MDEKISEKPLPPLMRLSNGVLIPTKDFVIAIHDLIIHYRRQFGKEDPVSIRNDGIIQYLCDVLADRMHKYKDDYLENALYVATETFYYIACQHPFTEGNKSTGFVCTLSLLFANIGTFNEKVSEKGRVQVKIELSPRIILNAPKEAEEITKLADAGKDELEVKKLIKGFFQRYTQGGR